MRPLSDTIVLDFTHMLSGPYGTMLLADLGAQTIKIEPPLVGEGTGRLLAQDSDNSVDGRRSRAARRAKSRSGRRHSAAPRAGVGERLGE